MSQFNRKSILLSAAVAAAITTTDYTMAQQATLEEVLSPRVSVRRACSRFRWR